MLLRFCLFKNHST